MLLKRFLRDESGMVSAERSLIASLVAFAIVSGLRVAGPRLAAQFGHIPIGL